MRNMSLFEQESMLTDPMKLLNPFKSLTLKMDYFGKLIITFLTKKQKDLLSQNLTFHPILKKLS